MLSIISLTVHRVLQLETHDCNHSLKAVSRNVTTNTTVSGYFDLHAAKFTTSHDV